MFYLFVPVDSPKAKAPVAKKLEKYLPRLPRRVINSAVLIQTASMVSVKTSKPGGMSVSLLRRFCQPKNNGKRKSDEAHAFLQYLEPAQDALGEYNDNVVDANYLEKAKPTQMHYLRGWFSGRI